jgi:putative transposase
MDFGPSRPFVTRCRREVFDDKVLTRCEQVTRSVFADFGAELAEFDRAGS